MRTEIAKLLSADGRQAEGKHTLVEVVAYDIKGNKIVSVDGRDGPSNHNRLCVKGRYGFDYVHHKQRLTKPLIRKAGVPDDIGFMIDQRLVRSPIHRLAWSHHENQIGRAHV